MPASTSARCTCAAVLAAALGAAAPALAHEEIYPVTLAGPPSSAATGSALVTFDLDLVTLNIAGSFAGLAAVAAMARRRRPG